MVLKCLLEPSSVAIIGASEKEGSIGNVVTKNMIEACFEGKIFPINPKNFHILGLKAYPSILNIEQSIDLAVIVTPAPIVPPLLEECGKKAIPVVIIISAGFKEASKAGEELEKACVAIAKKYHIRLLGPNCLGCLNTKLGLNTTFAATQGLKGQIAFLSQSGALCTAFLDWSLEKHLGLSVLVSLGSMSDIDFGDLLEYLYEDENTKAIFMYVETIGDVQKFARAATKIATTKPLFVIKAGKTEASAKAAASHTGSLSGDDAVFSFAMEQMGVKRLDTIEQFFSMALLVGKQPFPKGKQLTIITNAGGPGVLAVDAALKHGAELAQLSKKSLEALGNALPDAWSHGNPVDVLGDASIQRFHDAIKICLEDEATDILLVILTPQDMTDAKGIAKVLVEIKTHKPILTSWMGSYHVAEGKHLLHKSGIPCFDFPDGAAVVISLFAEHRQRILKLSKQPRMNFQSLDLLSVNTEKQQLKILSETESKQWLVKEGIPVVKNYLATTKEQAADLAEKIGFPVVIKLSSSTITHKSDVGGVALNLQDRASVVKAFENMQHTLDKKNMIKDFEGVAVQKMIQGKGFEVILGAKKDPQWGMVILFGGGGQFVEIYKDRSLALAPLNHASAKEMLEQTKFFSILQGARGQQAVDIDALCGLLVKFSLAVIKDPSLQEIDINPLFISNDLCIALDARILVT
jgi:acetyltransferase